MMDSSDFVLDRLRQNITENSLQLKALIQDINACVGPLVELHVLNSAGRSKISTLRKSLDKFSDIAKESKDPELLKEVVIQREQLASSMDAFKKANLKSMLSIEKSVKEELLKPTKDESVLRQRQKRDKESLVKMSSNVTDQLLSISKQLADTTQRSAATLETLVTSSDSVTGTQEELKVTSSAIGQSGKLLAKYGRRECTDKILMFFAFGFFIACVFYIVQKRVF
ncbi:vesicle transport protein Sec20 [Leptinotarsa decemlineata]|uniref:vesicle transport protein Sec20 n=1 Tax=Leptinotarsa decemlineata TaxID=7539 RepID=UPI000C252CC1|nr:vesicle transport protein SEC20 [Leptinotarsa decemlineata]